MNFPFASGWQLSRCHTELSQAISPFRRSHSWLPGLGGAVLLLLLWSLGIAQALVPLGHRLLFRLRGAQSWDERIVLLKIDQKSLDALGWFPWQRDRYSALLQFLTQSGPNTVVFDLVFSEESPEDSALAHDMQTHGRVILATAWQENREPWSPNSRLSEAAIATGHIIQLMTHQSLKEAQTLTLPEIQGYPALAIAAAQVHQLIDPDLQFSTNRYFSPSSPLLPNWPAPVSQLEQYSFVDVLNQQVPAHTFRNKIILVGMTAQGMDSVNTPFDRTNSSSGVHLHATLLHNLLQHSLLRPLPRWFWIVVCGGWIVFCRYGLTGFAIARQIALLAVGGGGWILLSVAALEFNYSVPIVMPLCLLGGTGLTSLVRHSNRLSQLNRQLRNKAIVDETTQIKNRLFFNDYSAFLWRKMMDEIHPLSLILCDVDHFKLYNDTYGHPAGDHCLYQVAQAIQACLHRESDIVARYGGEEFIVLLPTTDLDGAAQVAEKIQVQLCEQAIPHRASLTSHQVTLSLGIASIRPSVGTTLKELIEQADQALYKAKQQGRNRYCTA